MKSIYSAIVFVTLSFFALASPISAQIFPIGSTNSIPSPLEMWSFWDNENWTSDTSHVPLSFTNLGNSYLGDGASLVVDTNVAAWLNYNVIETDGTTNLTVDTGTVAFWFAPDWASTNLGGTGPGDWGRLLEVGGYTPDSSYGWWSIYVDDVGANVYFSAQTNDFSGGVNILLSFPIAWTNAYFHFIALTYSPTNTALYLDGVLATNGLPLTIYPGPDVLANGFFIGSDSDGLQQAHGMFNNLFTFNVPLDTNSIQTIFSEYFPWYMMNPFNMVMNLASAPSSPSTNYSNYDIITGPGNLQLAGSTTAITSTNVWITNVVVSTVGRGTNNMRLQFTIQGGSNSFPYDTFVNSVLDFSFNTNKAWAWMGQGLPASATATIPSETSPTISKAAALKPTDMVSNVNRRSKRSALPNTSMICAAT